MAGSFPDISTPRRVFSGTPQSTADQDTALAPIPSALNRIHSGISELFNEIGLLETKSDAILGREENVALDVQSDTAVAKYRPGTSPVLLSLAEIVDMIETASQRVYRIRQSMEL